MKLQAFMWKERVLLVKLQAFMCKERVLLVKLQTFMCKEHMLLVKLQAFMWKERVLLVKLQAFWCSFTKNRLLHIIFKEFVLFSKTPITRNFMVPCGTFTKACSLAQSQSPLRKRTSYHIETSQIICSANWLVYIRLY